jgi:hypothetical protein
MPAPSTREAPNLHREAQALIKQAAVQQTRRPAFASKAARGTTVVCRAPRCQFTRVARWGNPPTRAERRSGSESLTRADRSRMATPVTSSTPGGRATRRRGRW